MLNNKMRKMALLKFRLFAEGLKISENAEMQITKEYNIPLTIRDGIAGGLDFCINDQIYISAPIKEHFVEFSPFVLKFTNDNNYWVFENETPITKVKVLSKPAYIGKTTSNGISFVEIGQTFTDRLGIAPFGTCYFSINNNHCKFCEIGYIYDGKVKAKNLSDILETIEIAFNDELLPSQHLLISGGTPSPTDIKFTIKICKEIRKQYEFPIYVMLPPLYDKKILDEFYTIGINEIGINIEIFNRKIARKLIPAKYNIGLKKYIEYLEYATYIFGKHNSRSIIIVGLEDETSTLKGIEKLLEKGIMPILSPFRPIIGTELEKHSTFSGEQFLSVYEKSLVLSEKYKINLGPLCIPCQNNTITLPINDRYKFY